MADRTAYVFVGMVSVANSMAGRCYLAHWPYLVGDMAWLANATVRTSGINWESVGTIIAAVVAAMTFVLGLFARYVSGQITGSIDKFRIDVISRLDTRITILEFQVFGKKPHDDSLYCSSRCDGY